MAVELPEEDDAAGFRNTFAERQAVEGSPRPAAQPAPTAASQVLIVTTNEVPGYEIVDVHGDVFGLIVRARNIFSNMGASLKGIVGGEVGGYTKLLSESRDETRERLAAETLRRGGNAVLAVRFDCNEIADIMSEVAAYGTAVTVRDNRSTLG